jgi:hypothetical protein
MTSRSLLAALSLSFSLSALPGTAVAGEHPCAQDTAKFCADTKLGHGRSKCLLDHAEKLSPACRERVTKGRGKPESSESKEGAQEN